MRTRNSIALQKCCSKYVCINVQYESNNKNVPKPGSELFQRSNRMNTSNSNNSSQFGRAHFRCAIRDPRTENGRKWKLPNFQKHPNYIICSTTFQRSQYTRINFTYILSRPNCWDVLIDSLLITCAWCSSRVDFWNNIVEACFSRYTLKYRRVSVSTIFLQKHTPNRQHYMLAVITEKKHRPGKTC